jgi:hypothetical protein
MFIRPHPYTCLGIECRDEVHASPITDRVQLRLRAAVQVADEGADVERVPTLPYDYGVPVGTG